MANPPKMTYLQALEFLRLEARAKYLPTEAFTPIIKVSRDHLRSNPAWQGIMDTQVKQSKYIWDTIRTDLEKEFLESPVPLVLSVDADIKNKKIVKIFNKVYLPEGVSITFSYSQCIVTGPLGILYINLKRLYKMPQQISQAKKFLYSYQTAVRTAVQGVCYGHVEKVKLEGSGYKVMRCKPLKMKRTMLSLDKPFTSTLPYRMVPVLTIRLGYSKLSQFRIPQGVKAAYNRFGQILFTSVSKSKLTAFTTKIRRAREPNPYRYRGVYKVGPLASRKILKTPGKKN